VEVVVGQATTTLYTSSGGGGAGGVAIKLIDVTSVSSVSVTVGAGVQEVRQAACLGAMVGLRPSEPIARLREAPVLWCSRWFWRLR
jgi:hypothetical protein